MTERHNRCPVCGARFRGHAVCSRCGVDLTAVMKPIVEAWALRRRARAALASGSLEEARALLKRAQRRHATPRGHTLMILANWTLRPGE